MMIKSLVLLSAACSVANAHFLLKYPKSIGFEDKQEDKGPCGGFTPDLSQKLFDFHVGGEAVAMKLTHPQGNWLFRVTTDPKAESNWEQVFPIVQQSGIGDFCEPQITVPSQYAGKKGIVSVVSSATDGLLYQCVAVNFIDGQGDKPSECNNGSSVKGSFTDDSQLTAQIGNGSATTSSASGSASKTSSSSSSATSKNAASSPRALEATSIGLGCVVAALSMATFGGVFMM